MRVRLELPEKFDFSTEIPIRISDINYGNHLGHDAILPLAHEARLQFLKHFGYTELDIEGASYVMADAVIVYKAQAFYGQTLKIEIAVADFAPKSCDFFYRVTDKETGTEVARLKTSMVFYDYRKGKPTDTPEKFRARFARA
ncbi:MAG: thioesterase [Chloroflexi bacterium]|nr:thioesterase [Chloroflexota bacterium]